MRGPHKLRRRFWPSLFTLVFVITFVSLGFWQLDRAQYKASLISDLSARRTLPPVTPKTSLDVSNIAQNISDYAYRKISLVGRYRPELTLFLDNKMHQSEAGYHALTLFDLEAQGARSGDAPTSVLVNRGWVKSGTSRTQLPQLITLTATSTISGNLRRLEESVFSLGDNPVSDQWPQVWTHIDAQSLRLRLPIVPDVLVVNLDPGAPGSDSLIQKWPRPNAYSVSRHHGYAVQWFLMAVVLLIMYVFLMKRFDN